MNAPSTTSKRRRFPEIALAATALALAGTTQDAWSQPHPNYITGVPDWSQPIYLDNHDNNPCGGGAPVFAQWMAYCTPASTANIMGYYRDRAVNPILELGDGAVFPANLTCFVDGPPSRYRDDMTNVAGLHLGDFYGTNTIGPGTPYPNIGSGLTSYLHFRNLPNHYLRNFGASLPYMTVPIYNIFDTTNDCQAYHTDAAGFSEIIREIDADRPLLGHWAHGDLLFITEVTDSETFPDDDVTRYLLLEFDESSDPIGGTEVDDESGEQWNVSFGLGHTMTIVGYYRADDPNNPFFVDAVVVFDNRDSAGPATDHVRLPIVLPWTGSPWAGLTMVAPMPVDPDPVIYVDDDADGDGTSWNLAYGDLQAALDEAAMISGPVEVRVAGGTYLPSIESTPGEPRTATFVLPEGVRMYGGFGGQATPEDRDLSKNVSILSGNIGDPASAADNAIHVVSADSVSDATMIDGFVFTEGNANVVAPGAGRGAGMIMRNSQLRVRRVRFLGNDGFVGSALAVLNGSDPILADCTFSGNHTTYEGGAAIFGGTSLGTLINCSFTGNTSGTAGSAIYINLNSTPVITNCILWGNVGTVGQIAVGTGSPTVSYSCVEGGFVGTQNVDVDPVFRLPNGIDGVAGTPDDNLRLQVNSPLIDQGLNGVDPCNDLDSANRDRVVSVIQNPPTVDMGAYEFQDIPCGGDLNGDFVVGIVDLLQLVSLWGPCGGCIEDIDGDGSVAITDLLLLLQQWGICP